MHLLNYKDIDEDIYIKSKPNFNNDNFSYKRNEKQGYISIHSKKLPAVHEIFINPTAQELLKLCNGKRNPEEISEKATEVFKGVSKETVYDDLKCILFQYSKYALIDWEEGVNPFMKRYNMNLDDDFTLLLANESDLTDIKIFLEKNINSTNMFYLNTTRRIEEYTDELVLRQKLFMYSEEFVLLRNRDNQLVGVLSVLIPSNMKSTCSSIGIINMPSKFISDALLLIINTIKEISVKKLSKIKYQHILDNNENELLKKLFLENGFISEAILNNEYENKDIEIISYIL